MEDTACHEHVLDAVRTAKTEWVLEYQESFLQDSKKHSICLQTDPTLEDHLSKSVQPGG